MGLNLLFVGNDWDVLDEMQRSTRTRRGEWDMTFACGGLDANRHLAITDQLPEVVICQDVLPATDGFELLKSMEAKADDPLCLVLASSRNVQLVSESIPWVHGCLRAPLDPEELAAEIARLRADRGAAKSAAIQHLTADIEHLPSLPSTYQKVVEITNRRDFSLREISQVIQLDVGLTAETLRMVNSTFFGLRGEIDSVEQAVNLLGLDMVRGLVLANSLFDEQEASCIVDLDLVSGQSQKVAAVARVIAEIDGSGKSEQALSFLAGMLHLVGVLLMPVPDTGPLDPSFLIEPDLDADVERFAADRFAIGTYLLRMWDFEQGIIEAVAALAQPDLADGTVAASLLTAVRLVELEGFPVARFVEGDEEVRTKVAALRDQWDQPLAA